MSKSSGMYRSQIRFTRAKRLSQFSGGAAGTTLRLGNTSWEWRMGGREETERSTSRAMNFYLGGGIYFHGQFGKTCEGLSIGLISDYFRVWPKVTRSALGRRWMIHSGAFWEVGTFTPKQPATHLRASREAARASPRCSAVSPAQFRKAVAAPRRRERHRRVHVFALE